MNPPLPAGITAKPTQRKVTTMTKILATLALGGAAAAAIALAPTAGANTLECDSNGPAAVCSKPGHASITANPGQSRANPGFGFWPFGAGPQAPVFAID